MATMQQIADELNLSRWTVSMIVNGTARKKGISAATISKVKDHMDRRGYVPSRQALSLKNGNGNRTGILYCGSLYSHLLDAYNIITGSLNSQPALLENVIVPGERVLEGLKELLARGVSNLVWIESLAGNATSQNPGLLPYLKNFNKTVIYNYHFSADDNSDELIETGCHLVGLNRTDGYARLARFIKRSGHTRVALPDLSILGTGVRPLWEGAFTKQGITVHPLKVRAGWDTPLPAAAEKCAAELAGRYKKEKITAVCFLNDEFAVRTIRELQQVGISIPEQLTVTGFGNHPVSELSSPALTTLAMPVDKMTGLALQKLTGRGRAEKHVLVPKLTKRESHREIR